MWEWDSIVQNKIYQAFKTRKTKEQRMGKWRGEEEEAEAGGETAIDKMEMVGDMGVTGDVVVSGCDDKN